MKKSACRVKGQVPVTRPASQLWKDPRPEAPTPGPEGLCPAGGLPPAAPGCQSASPGWLAIMRVLLSLNSHLQFRHRHRSDSHARAPRKAERNCYLRGQPRQSEVQTPQVTDLTPADRRRRHPPHGTKGRLHTSLPAGRRRWRHLRKQTSRDPSLRATPGKRLRARVNCSPVSSRLYNRASP